jgi:hypothetical protein
LSGFIVEVCLSNTTEILLHHLPTALLLAFITITMMLFVLALLLLLLLLLLFRLLLLLFWLLTAEMMAWTVRMVALDSKPSALLCRRHRMTPTKTNFE